MFLRRKGAKSIDDSVEKNGQILSDLLDKIALILAVVCIFFLFVYN